VGNTELVIEIVKQVVDFVGEESEQGTVKVEPRRTVAIASLPLCKMSHLAKTVPDL